MRISYCLYVCMLVCLIWCFGLHSPKRQDKQKTTENSFGVNKKPKSQLVHVSPCADLAALPLSMPVISIQGLLLPTQGILHPPSDPMEHTHLEIGTIPTTMWIAIPSRYCTMYPQWQRFSVIHCCYFKF